MLPGTTFAGRFLIEELAGRGGMGEVFRARDLTTGSLAAVKVMRGSAALRDRFLREASVLERLRHPGIVRYITHGTTDDAMPWVAMEWLVGEDLERRLARRGLLLGESLALVRAIAEALGHAHAQGITHRDVKPSNILLIDDDPSRPKLLDFGIAHLAAATRALTEVGAVVGTVGYMAPEQASGAEVDARTDVFALGCVMFECLTGQPAFFGQNPLACLAKLLVGDPPRAKALRPSLGDDVDDLASRMLARDPDLRPRDGAEVAHALEAIANATSRSIPAPAPSLPRMVTLGEQRVHSVVLAELAEPSDGEAPTLTPEQLHAGFAPLEAAAQRFGGRLVHLGPSVALLSLEGRESASDQAEQAILAATELLAVLPSARVAVATGRAESTASGPVGPLIDRAFALLRDAGSGSERVIPIDDATRGLLGTRFEVETSEGGHRLVHAKAVGDPTARLLGRPIPCVGRERELASLEGTLAESVAESVARAVVVTAPPGTGKTRLFEELRVRAIAREPTLRVIVARAEPVRASSPFALVRALVRSAMGGVDRDVGRSRNAVLEGAKRLGLAPAQVEALLSLVGLGHGATSDERDASAQRDDLRRAFETWLGAEAMRAPVLLAIEDLQWADATSAAVVAQAWKKLGESPIFLVALARPEVSELLPDFAREVSAQELRLGGLVKRAAERLVRAALGDRVDDRMVARLVDLSDGNAFYLEELVRWVAEGRGTQPDSALDLPDSVVAMAQVRLLRLDDEARRLLRVASVLDAAFGVDELMAMLGTVTSSDMAREATRALLERLVRDEVLVELEPTRYGFRHALLRAAAYAMLTDADRASAHAMAGEHLALLAKPEPTVVARHFELAGDRARAATWLVRAAREALDVGQVGDVDGLVDRGIAAGAEGEGLGQLWAFRAYARGRQGRWGEAASWASRALELLPRGSTSWFRTAASIVFAESNEGRLEGTIGVLQGVLGLTDTPEPSAAYGRTVCILVSALAFTGQTEIADQLLLGLGRTAATVAPGSAPLFEVYVATARSIVALSGRNDLGTALRESKAAIERLENLDDAMGTILTCTARARALIDAAAFDEADRMVSRARAEADRTGSPYMRDWATLIGVSGGVLQKKVEGLREELAPIVALESPVLRALGHLSVAIVALEQGLLDEAAIEVDRGAAAFAPPFVQAIASSHRARIAFERGEPAKALTSADEGIALRKQAGGVLVDGTWLHYTRTRALFALGRSDEALAALEEATARLERLAAPLAPSEAERFLRDIEPNRETMSLARTKGLRPA